MLIHGKRLIEHRIEAFVAAGITEIVINVFHKAEMIQSALGDGSRYGAAISYSVEPSLLETGGGVYRALPLLGPDPFIVTNADIWTNYPLERLIQRAPSLAHIVLVPNPAHHMQGDFALENGLVLNQGEARMTFSGISYFHPEFFAHSPAGAFGLGVWLQAQADNRLVTGELYQDIWVDVGTPERLAAIEANRNGTQWL